MLKNLDRRDGLVYEYAGDEDPLRLAVQVALATERPLLLRGDPGVGKSSVAACIARELKWRYYEHAVTARTEATDLLWTFDAVRKLGDATMLVNRRADATLDDHDYVQPGRLWWAFDPDGARQRGGDRDGVRPAAEPLGELNGGRSPDGAVLLIDEVDKADPDLPNALLVPLGSRQFDVAETGTRVVQRAKRVLIVITTNEERELPPAFLRRCVPYRVPAPDPAHLERIAAAHARVWGRPLQKAEEKLVAEIAEHTSELQDEARAMDLRPPGVAEFLDAVTAAMQLGITVDDPRWTFVRRLTLAKDERLS